MKIAICFSGQIRTGIQTAPNIKRYIGDMWDDCDFFIHTWDFESSKPFARSTINGVPLIPRENHIISDEKIKQFSLCYNPKIVIVDIFKKYAEAYSQDINPIWFTTSECFKLMEKYSIESNTQYDVIVKIRPDIMFGKTRRLKNDIDFYLKNTSILYSDCHTGIRLDDVFWILDFKNACKMYEIFDYIKNRSINDEKAVLEFLNFKNIVIADTNNTFQYTIYRNESYMFDPMTQFKECFRNDILHYASNITEEEHFKKIYIEDEQGIRYD